MPTLKRYTLPNAPTNVAIETIRDAFDSAMDLSATPIKLNESVALITESTLEFPIKETQCPAIRMRWKVAEYLTDASAHCMVAVRVELSYFFIYYYGQNNGNFTQDFLSMRESHIRWNLEHLKQKGVKPNPEIGITMPTNQWKFWEGYRVTIDHKPPLEDIDEALRRKWEALLLEGYTITRADDMIRVHNHS